MIKKQKLRCNYVKIVKKEHNQREINGKNNIKILNNFINKNKTINNLNIKDQANNITTN